MNVNSKEIPNFNLANDSNIIIIIANDVQCAISYTNGGSTHWSELVRDDLEIHIESLKMCIFLTQLFYYTREFYLKIII